MPRSLSGTGNEGTRVVCQALMHNGSLTSLEYVAKHEANRVKAGLSIPDSSHAVSAKTPSGLGELMRWASC